jgi:hypothetical protein
MARDETTSDSKVKAGPIRSTARVYAGFNWLRIGSSDRTVLNTEMNLRHSIKDGTFFDHLSNCQLLKNYAPRSYN